MKRAALYMRVSTVDQHPETQLHDLHLMAQQRGLEIVCEYVDKISGTKARRPGLDELMRDARRGRFDVVLVWACDRMARSVRHFLEVLDDLNRLQIEFISFRENLDTGGPLGRALVVIISAIADYVEHAIMQSHSTAVVLWPACHDAGLRIISRPSRCQLCIRPLDWISFQVSDTSTYLSLIQPK